MRGLVIVDRKEITTLLTDTLIRDRMSGGTYYAKVMQTQNLPHCPVQTFLSNRGINLRLSFLNL